MKKYLFCILLFLNFSNLFSAAKTEFNLEQFLEVLGKAESVYLNQDDDKKVEALTLSQKLKIRDELYKYRDQFDEYLNGYLVSKEVCNSNEFEMVSTQLMPLLKEVTRHFEAHLIKQHNWQKPRHFSRIAKPLVLTSSMAGGLLAITKILETTEIISPEMAKKVYKGICIGGVGVLGAWILYNYRDVLARKFTCKT